MAGGTIAVDKLLLILETQFKGATQTKQIDNAMKDIKKSTDQATNGFKRANMGLMSLGFGMLFTGMAIKQFTDRTIQGLQQNFMTLADEESSAAQGILSMQAALMFLKFSLVETFGNTALFQNMVIWIVEAAVAVADFVQRNPELAEFAARFLFIAAAIGTVMMPLGQMLLLMFALQSLTLPFALSMLMWFGALTVLLIGVSALWVIWNSDMDKSQKIMWTIAAVLITIGLVFGILFTWVWLVVAAVGIFAAAIAILSTKVGGVGNAFLAVGVFILWILALVADGIIYLVLAPINMLIAALNTVISLSNSLLGTNFNTIDPIEFSVAKKVDVLRDSMLQKGEEKRLTDLNNAASTSSDPSDEAMQKQAQYNAQELFNLGFTLTPSTDT